MKTLKFCVSFVFIAVLAGCADMDAPTPQQIVQNPIGPSSVKKGMSKDEVLLLYGDPDMKSMVKSKGWETKREEWFYNARMSGLPVGADYLAKDLYLYFDEDSLTNISREQLGKEIENEREDAESEQESIK